MKVLVAHEKSAELEGIIESYGLEVEVTYVSSGPAIVEALDRVQPEAVFSLKSAQFPGELHRPFVTHPAVKWVQVGGSGFDHLLPWDSGRLTVTNSAGILSESLAETVTGAMLGINGNLFHYRDQQHKADWQPRSFRPMGEQTLLVVGLGHIGSYVARNAKALGMTVLATRRRSDIADANVDEMHPPNALGELLPRADVVSLHLRLNRETLGLINAQMLGLMKADAILINTSRGPVVDEADLVSALKSGHLRGCYLDVFQEEPLSKDNPLWREARVLVTPHAADNLHDWPHRFCHFFAENLSRFQRGDDLLNQVQP